MNDQGTLERVIERLPVFDGGVRRRFIAGTIVIGALLYSFKGLRDLVASVWVGENSSSGSAIAASAFLIYALGFLVELIGELFLARAVAGGVWGWSALWQNVRGTSRWLRYALLPLFALVGPFVFLFGFLKGFLSICRWQMRIERSLSSVARHKLNSFDNRIQDAVKSPLGKKADFGRKALVDSFELPADRRWARGLLERPRDVLAIVSAVVVSAIVLSTQVPSLMTHSVREASNALSEASAKAVDRIDVLAAAVPSVTAMKDLSALKGGIIEIGEGNALMLSYRTQDGERYRLLDCSNGAWPEKECEEVNRSFHEVWQRALLLEKTKAQSATLRWMIVCSIVLAACLLYLAFFLTLDSAVVSILEALASRQQRGMGAPISMRSAANASDGEGFTPPQETVSKAVV